MDHNGPKSNDDHSRAFGHRGYPGGRMLRGPAHAAPAPHSTKITSPLGGLQGETDPPRRSATAVAARHPSAGGDFRKEQSPGGTPDLGGIDMKYSVLVGRLLYSLIFVMASLGHFSQGT